MMGDLTFKQWAAVTAVTIGIFAGLFLGAFWTAEKGVRKVEGYRFDELYLLINDVVSMYSDSGERAAAIAGYLRCMDPDEVLTIWQINAILALR